MTSLVLAAVVLVTGAPAEPWPTDTLRYPAPWFAVGGGFAERRVDTDFRPQDAEFDGLGIYLSMGVHVSGSLSVGIDALHAGKNRQRSTFVLAAAGFHPRGRSGPFVRGGLGAGRSSGPDAIIDDVARLRVAGTVAAFDHIAGDNPIRPAVSVMLGWAVPLPLLNAHVAGFAGFGTALSGPHPARVSMVGASLMLR